jgi:hypothetical protein
MSTWAVVYVYGWYMEPYCFYRDKNQAETGLFKAKRARPNATVRLVEVK